MEVFRAVVLSRSYGDRSKQGKFSSHPNASSTDIFKRAASTIRPTSRSAEHISVL